MSVSSKVAFKIKIGADHKDGQGNLIARSVSIQAPDPPVCTKPKCLWKFFWDTISCGLLSAYHRYRVEYAEKYRRKRIPMKYRTGEDSPQTVIGAILAIIRLKLRR
jgi:hypothetical protein